MKTWQQILIAADVFVRFLERGSFYDRPYTGDLSGKFVTADAVDARRFATDDSFDEFDEWETVSDSSNVFPDDFEWSLLVKSQLRKNGHWGIESKNFNGTIEKWSDLTSFSMLELMRRDVEIIFQCYANEYFPSIWKDILNVYLNGGFPCGWNGRYPGGQLVVFSNVS
ncbi:hypothetical protein [Burkholderia sp. BCC1999]|uniref:hypothetical protein n=1 Tax=Burkholderia sp. BCC1999 TaxID=2817448 RepID=UPI002AC35FD2|nr:hypothetical protein [Burkholderia sp. BCC1999]